MIFWFELADNSASRTRFSDSSDSTAYQNRPPCTTFDKNKGPVTKKTELSRIKRSGPLVNKGEKVKTQPSSGATSVTNLSKHELSAPQLSLLEKGLKFIPSRHEVDKVKLLADLSEWERRMRLAEYFYNRDDDTKEQTKDSADKFIVKKEKHLHTERWQR